MSEQNKVSKEDIERCQEAFKQKWVDVSEQSRRLVEKNERIKQLEQEINGNGGWKDMVKGFQFKIENLEQELSEAKTIAINNENALNQMIQSGRTRRMELEQQLSTHQAMLEKMRIALEVIVKDEYDYGTGFEGNEAIQVAKQALEEYQTMKKGAGK